MSIILGDYRDQNQEGEKKKEKERKEVDQQYFRISNDKQGKK